MLKTLNQAIENKQSLYPIRVYEQEYINIFFTQIYFILKFL